MIKIPANPNDQYILTLETMPEPGTVLMWDGEKLIGIDMDAYLETYLESKVRLKVSDD